MPTHLGHLDASDPAEHKNLDSDRFVRTDRIVQALADSVPFVCGRKGAGKTAVAHFLQTTRKWSSVVDIAASDYELIHLQPLAVFQHHRESMELPEPMLINYFRRAWTLVLHLAVCAAAERACRLQFPTSEQRRELTAFLRGIGDPDRSPVQMALEIMHPMLERSLTASAALIGVVHEVEAAIRRPEFVAARQAAGAILS